MFKYKQKGQRLLKLKWYGYKRGSDGKPEIIPEEAKLLQRSSSPTWPAKVSAALQATEC